MNADTRVEMTEQLATKKLDAGLIVLNVESGEYYRLNETAAAMFVNFKGGLTLGEVVGKITEEYEAPNDVVTADAEELLQRLSDLGLVKLS